MRLYNLNDICLPKQWPTISINDFTGSGYPVYGANGKIGFFSSYTHEKETLLITCRGATCGRINICEPKSYVNGNAMALDNLSENVSLLYLYYYFINRGFKDIISGSAQPQITREGLKQVKIPLPPLSHQEKIAAVLDRADGLRRKRKAAIEKLDRLIQSVFNHFMRKQKNSLMSLTLDQVAENRKGAFVNGPFGSDLLTSELQLEGVPVIYIRDIKKGYYERISKACVSNSKAEQLAVCKVLPGDILIAKVGDPPGTACIYPSMEQAGIVTQDVIRICVNNTLADPRFIVSYLNSSLGRWKLSSITVQGTRMRFSLGRFKKIQVELPHISAQKRFSNILMSIENQKAKMQASLQKLDENFNSLLQRAFKGELDFSDTTFSAMETDERIHAQ